MTATIAATSLVLRALLAFILGRAALHKLRAPAQFIAELRAYQLLSQTLASPIAVAFMLAESIAAICLLNPAWHLPALIAASLFVIYGGAMAINLFRGRTELDCGCGGPLGTRTTIDWLLVVRNGTLAAIALLISSIDAPPIGAALWLVVLPASAAALLLYASSEQALANHQRVVAWKR